MPRNVGEMGESVLRLWTSQVGIVSNKVEQDKTGWDYLLEFPPERATQPIIILPLDKAIPPIRSFLQVKSTDKRKGCWSVKLSNWLRLVKNLDPAFFLVLEFDSQPHPQRAFLVHIDEDYIGCVLKRLRETPPAEQSELHKKFMQFTYDEKDAIETLDGHGLEHAIRKHTGDNPFTYAEKKRHILERVGYEDGIAELNFDIIIPNNYRAKPYEFLVDFALGLIPSAQVQNPKFRDARFGIPEPEPFLQSTGTGELQITNRKPIGECDLLLRTPDDKYQCRMKASVYFPDGFHHLVDERDLKIRCAAPCLDFIFWANQPKLNIRYRFPSSDNITKLSQLISASHFLFFLHKTLSQGGEALLDLSTKGQSLLKGDFTVSLPIDDYTLQVAESIIHAWTVCKYFDIHDEVETSIMELLQQKERLWVLALSLGPLRKMSIVSWVNMVIEDTIREVCVPYVTQLVIGQYKMVFALAILGTPKPTGRTDEHGTEYDVRVQSIHIHRQHLYRRDEPLEEFSGPQLIQSIVENYQQQQIFCIILK